MIWRMAGFFFLLLTCGGLLFTSLEVFCDEPDPETYIPPFVEIREHAPAGVTDEWWARVSRSLIWHVTPEYYTIPSLTSHEPNEIIRSATTGFLIRGATDWEKWPPPLDGIYNRLEELEKKPVESGDNITIITNISGNLYGFEAEFPVPTSVWNVYFPTGKELDPAGTFDAAIWGVNAHSYSLIPGAGGVYQGIQFSLADEEWPAGTKGWGLFQLVDAKTAVVFYSPSGGADSVTIPSHTPESGLAGNVLRFE